MGRTSRVVVASVALATGAGCTQVFGLDEPVVITDAATDSGPDGPDPVASDAPVCFGAWSGTRTCFASSPIGTRVLSNTIDTDSPSGCALLDPLRCTITADHIELHAGVIVQVKGTRALVLIATNDIVIDGTLDASSHNGFTPVNGAGVGSTLCTAGTNPGSLAGGAGGSFGTSGGKGGNGGAGGTGGTAGPNAGVPTTIRAGCRGQGGNNAGGTAAGGGQPGGGISLVAGSSITVSGTGAIAANGAGGTTTTRFEAGGGGGGSGGMLALDAPNVTVLGTVWANGGGGAEGSGSTNTGAPGAEPSAYNASAQGGGGSALNGGDGGDGGLGSSNGTAGGAGSNATSGGGGGGGGAGIILIYAQVATLVSGQFSPTYRLNN